MLPAVERLPEVASFIRKKQCFVAHAQRQCGKAAVFRALMYDLNAKGDTATFYCSLPSAESIQSDVNPLGAFPANF